MSQPVSTSDDDSQILQNKNSRSSSSLATYNISRTSSQGSPFKKSRIIYISIILCLLVAVVILSTRKLEVHDQEYELQSKLKELSEEVSKLKGKQGGSIVVINDLKKEPIKTQNQAKQAHTTTQAQGNKNQIKGGNQGNSGAQGQGQVQGQGQGQGQQQRPSARQPAATNKAKHLYMTAELQKVSEKRRQPEGVKSAAKIEAKIDFLSKNKEGQTIDMVLYDEKSRQARKKFHEQRVSFTAAKKNFQGLYLASFNNKIDTSRDEQQVRVEEEEWKRIDKIWNFANYPDELPMCVVVPGYNNNAKFRIQYNLNSIFQQNYSNYFVVIINDASTDNSDEVYRKYFNFYNISQNRYAYLENQQRKTALENIYIATHDHCSPDSIVLNLDADDEFIGKNVLKTFNAAYQQYKAGVVYSNFYWYEQGGNVMLGFTSEYTDMDKQRSNYRQAPQRFSHLRSYRTELFLKIAAKDFQDTNGKFWTSAYDMVMYFPLMELSCGRVKKIEGYHYLYNINTGLNDYAVDRGKQIRIDQTVRKQPKYNCSVQFDQKMNRAS